MKSIAITIFIIVAVLSSDVFADFGVFIAGEDAEHSDRGGAEIGLSALFEVGPSGDAQLYASLGLGFGTEATEVEKGELMTNFTLGGRYLLTKNTFQPFFGVAFRYGDISHEIAAEDDNKDNDDDGSVDEDGEVDDETLYSELAMMGEVGVSYRPTQTFQIVLKGRYPLAASSEFPEEWSYGAEFAFLIGDDVDTPMNRDDGFETDEIVPATAIPVVKELWSVFHADSYAPVVDGAKYYYSDGSSIKIERDDHEDFNADNIGAHGGAAGSFDCDDNGCYLEHDDYLKPNWLAVGRYPSKEEPLIYEDASLEEGFSWTVYGMIKKYPIIRKSTVESIGNSCTDGGGTEYDDCVVLEVEYTFPDGFESYTYVHKETVLLARGVGFVDRTRYSTDDSSVNVHLTNYSGF